MLSIHSLLNSSSDGSPSPPSRRPLTLPPPIPSSSSTSRNSHNPLADRLHAFEAHSFSSVESARSTPSPSSSSPLHDTPSSPSNHVIQWTIVKKEQDQGQELPQATLVETINQIAVPSTTSSVPKVPDYCKALPLDGYYFCPSCGAEFLCTNTKYRCKSCHAAGMEAAAAAAALASSKKRELGDIHEIPKIKDSMLRWHCNDCGRDVLGNGKRAHLKSTIHRPGSLPPLFSPNPNTRERNHQKYRNIWRNFHEHREGRDSPPTVAGHDGHPPHSPPLSPHPHLHPLPPQVMHQHQEAVDHNHTSLAFAITHTPRHTVPYTMGGMYDMERLFPMINKAVARPPLPPASPSIVSTMTMYTFEDATSLAKKARR